MKVLSIVLSCLPALASCLSSTASHAEDGTHHGASNDILTNCNYAVHEFARVEGLFSRITITIGRGKPYTIPVFILNGQVPPADRRIVVWLQNGATSGVEFPKITAVCLNESPNPPPSGNDGDIDFHSKTNDRILITFHLDGLNITKWKPPSYVNGKEISNDSIWMVAYDGKSSPAPKPNKTDWPPCAKPKMVFLADDSHTHQKDVDISFPFDRCAHTGLDNTYYSYALHLDQFLASGKPPTDFPIDPLIINRP